MVDVRELTISSTWGISIYTSFVLDEDCIVGLPIKSSIGCSIRVAISSNLDIADNHVSDLHPISSNSSVLSIDVGSDSLVMQVDVAMVVV